MLQLICEVSNLQDEKKQFVFPEEERKTFVYAGRMLFLFEIILYCFLIATSITNKKLDGIWLTLFFAIVIGIIHIQNLRSRKYCLAKWSFDGMTFTVYIKNLKRSVQINKTFCIATTLLSFNRRYSSVKYPFILIWEPGTCAPYEEMNGYKALEQRDAIIIPDDDETRAIFRDLLHITDIPTWPKSGIYYGSQKK